MAHKSDFLLKKERMELTLARAKENFLAALTLEGKSPETVRWHNMKLTAFLNFVQPNGSEVKICELTLEDARQFIRSLMERKTKQQPQNSPLPSGKINQSHAVVRPKPER